LIRPGSKKVLVYFLVLLWIVVQASIFLYYGVKTSVDSPVYIGDAQNLLSGNFPESRSIWYLGYSLYLAAVFLPGGGLGAAVLVQILLSGVATYALYQVVKGMSGQELPALLAVLFYLLWFKIHHWNVFIYTESLFTSAAIISFALLTKSQKGWQYGLVMVLVAYTFLIRPTGIGFLLGAVGYVVYQFKGRVSLSGKVLVLIFGLVLAGAVLFINHMLYDHAASFLESYAKAEII
jgi:hypothetical protein